MNKYYGNENFNLKNAYEDCKQVFESITDENSFQQADTGLVMYYANEIMYALELATKAEYKPVEGAIVKQFEIEYDTLTDCHEFRVIDPEDGEIIKVLMGEYADMAYNLLTTSKGFIL